MNFLQNTNVLNIRTTVRSNDDKGTYRWWMLTLNNPDEDWKKQFSMFRQDYGIAQLEKGENGTVHIQGCFYYTKAVRATHFKGIRAWLKGISAQDAENVINYCRKNQTRLDGPIEVGKCPRTVGNKKDWDQALTLAQEGRIQEIQASILIPYFTSLQKIAATTSIPRQTDDVRGIWISGKPGQGKSHLVRTSYSSLYIKPQNKWFDGYMGEEAILLDDMDEGGKVLGHYLKIWADKWKCWGEIKGATTALKHKWFVVTSNYLPSDFWEGPMLEAIERRFRFIVVDNQQIVSDSLLGYIPNAVFQL